MARRSLFHWPPIGAPLDERDVQRFESSAHWHDGRFRNLSPRKRGSRDLKLHHYVQYARERGRDRVPIQAIPTRSLTRFDFPDPPPALRITWLGHATSMIEIGGVRLLLDPMFSQRASPFPFVGPKRFFDPPLPLAKRPRLDAVIITHDHYDHLDYHSVRQLIDDVPLWIVPLGVADHLGYWGVPIPRIVELDWHQETVVRAMNGNLTVTATSARHSSGRDLRLRDRGQTFWCGYALRSDKHGVYVSGDGGRSPQLKKIGQTLGPFDVTLMEIGAYSPAWVDAHMGPEQAVAVHHDIGARWMLPVHWGTFDLSVHNWTEPIERTLVAAQALKVNVLTPQPGHPLDFCGATIAHQPSRWWPDVSWRTAQEQPIVSSGCEDMIDRGLGGSNTQEARSVLVD